MVAKLLQDILDFDPTIAIDYATTPPSSWYRSDDILELEFRTVFSQNWMAVGSARQVESPGSYIAGQCGHEPYVVVRGADLQLRAFFNVCRHHAACLTEGRGVIEHFTCPYHGWRYALDGRLTKAPHLGPIKNFERKAFGLRPIEVHTWQGIVFIHFGQPTTQPAQLWPALDERLEQRGCRHLQFVEHRTYELNCNWKVFCDNYLDGGYHVSVLHPDLGDQLDLDGYQTEVFEGYSIQSASASTDGITRLGDGALYGFVYPNLMINRYGPIMDINVVVPTGAETCRVDFDFFFDPTVIGRHDFVEESIRKSDRVQQEDMTICGSVQRGLRSSAYDVGRYAPRLEGGMHAFHCTLAQELRKGDRVRIIVGRLSPMLPMVAAFACLAFPVNSMADIVKRLPEWTQKFGKNREQQVEYWVRKPCDTPWLEPIILVPPLLESAAFWRRSTAFINALDRVCPAAIYVVSLRGRGQSTAPPQGFEPEHHHADIATVARTEKLERFHLLGLEEGADMLSDTLSLDSPRWHL